MSKVIWRFEIIRNFLGVWARARGYTTSKICLCIWPRWPVDPVRNTSHAARKSYYSQWKDGASSEMRGHLVSDRHCCKNKKKFLNGIVCYCISRWNDGYAATMMFNQSSRSNVRKILPSPSGITIPTPSTSVHCSLQHVVLTNDSTKILRFLPSYSRERREGKVLELIFLNMINLTVTMMFASSAMTAKKEGNSLQPHNEFRPNHLFRYLYRTS